MRIVKKAFAVAALSLAAMSALAAPFGYATNYRSELWKIDMNTPGSVMVNANIGFVAQGLAATSNGKLWGTDGNLLYQVSAAPSVLQTNFNGLGMGSVKVGALDSAGSTLWGYDNNSKRLFEYDLTSNSIVTLSTAISDPYDINAMCLDSAGNFLFIDSQQHFGKITNGTWATSLIKANLGLADECRGMDFMSDGNLYAVVFGDTRYQLDPTTGNQLNGFYSGVHRDWAGLTGVPSVPEPATMLALVLGTAALLRRSKD